MYKLSCDDCLAGKNSWITHVKQLLCQNGYSYVWNQQDIYNDKLFIRCFKQRLIDNYYQSWNSDLEKSEVLQLYKNVKSEFCYEIYLDKLPFDLRTYICKIRLSAHNLHIQTGRYGRNRIPRPERYCMYCTSRDVEDEYHFIIKCPCFQSFRRKYIPRNYFVNPSMFKFVQLIKSEDIDIITNLAHFLKDAFAHRILLTHTT